MVELTTVGKRYQVVIPKKVRSVLGVREGQTMGVSVEGRRIALEPLSDDMLRKIPAYSEKEDEGRAEKFLTRHAGR